MMASTDIAKEFRRRDSDRRNADNAVRNVRERLTSDIVIRPDFDHELLSTYCKNQLAIVPVSFLLATAMAATVSVYASPTDVITWLAGAFSANGVLIFTCKRFERILVRSFQARVWRARLISVEFFTGSFWKLSGVHRRRCIRPKKAQNWDWSSVMADASASTQDRATAPK